MRCRSGCGACCIAPSITSPLPGMPDGKPAGVRCINLDESLNCTLFNDSRRPAFCADLAASVEMCGNNQQEALVGLYRLENLTNPF